MRRTTTSPTSNPSWARPTPSRCCPTASAPTCAAYDLDAPIPDLPIPDTYHSFARAMLSKARRDHLTLRGLYNLVAAARGHWVLCGSPETIARTLEHWFTTGAADGFNIMPPHLPAGLDDFADQVVPILQHRGLFRRRYTGETLRDHLNLPRPVLAPVPPCLRPSCAACSAPPSCCSALVSSCS